MPLLVPAEGTTPVIPPVVPLVVAAPNVSVTSITDPSGKVWVLDGSAGIWCQPGRRGFDMPHWQIWEDVSPAVDGAFYRGTRAEVRELFQPLYFGADDRSALMALRRSFMAAISPRRGECTLTVSQPDGTRRSIKCRYLSGMEGEEGRGHWGILHMSYGLVLRALEPFWFGADITTKWAGSPAARDFLPIPGADGNWIVVAPSQVLGTTTAVNEGDVEAWPVWTINGPASGSPSITLTNNTTGKTLTLNASLTGASNKRIIDTQPGAGTIKDEAGVNKWSELGDGSALWSLQPGVNDLSVSVAGSSTATEVQLVYRPRFVSV